MPMKNILVAYNGNETSDHALRLSMAVAAKRDAHLTGVFAYDVQPVMSSANSWLTERLTRQLKDLSERMEQDIVSGIRQRFEAVVADAASPDKVHWIDQRGTADEVVSKIARGFDLTVMGKFNPSEFGERLELHPDIVALKSGKPIIVVPELSGTPKMGDNVVVGWDGKRTSSKAVSDLLQILPPIKRITLLRIDDRASETPDPTSMRMLKQIERHGVEAGLIIRARRKSIGRTLIDVCDELDASLLVMGAYEHSKFSEDLIGGVTNEILRDLTRPVMMSH